MAAIRASSGTITNTYTAICGAMPRRPSRIGLAPAGRVGLSATVMGTPHDVGRKGHLTSLVFTLQIQLEQRVLDDLGQCGMDPVLLGGHLPCTEVERHRLDQ